MASCWTPNRPTCETPGNSLRESRIRSENKSSCRGEYAYFGSTSPSPSSGLWWTAYNSTLVSANSSNKNGEMLWSGIGTLRIRARTRSHASSTLAPGTLSSSSTKMTDCSLLDVERINRTSSNPSIASSSGSVTSFSICSADAPCHRVVTRAILSVNSGSSRRGMVKKLTPPQATSNNTNVIVIVGRRTANSGRPLMAGLPQAVK